ncbi:hypothetical protein HZC53_03040 [Candidatus Uhrbacteria bacterium]|nr:hypothetical protein [Candidatus Uhrbacteria bacterium]
MAGMNALSKGIVNQLLNALKTPGKQEIPEEARINVHHAVSRFSVLYEKIRNAVDYKDEHLLRKSAIKRILSRQLLLENDSQVIALNLVRELIGARYLPNNELPDYIIGQVAVRVAKYLAIQRAKVGSEKHYAWLRGILSVEIEEVLVDATQEKALVTFLYERLADRVRVQGVAMESAEVRLQLYLACYRCLVKADEETLGFKLLRAYLPEWLRPEGWLSEPQGMAERMIGVERRIRLSLTHPLALKFQRVVKPWAVSLNVLREALLEKPDEAKTLLDNPESLNAVVSRIAERRYKQSKAKLRRGAVRATIYLLLTKMLLAFVLEVPMEWYWYGGVSYAALLINMLFPPVFMFTVSLFIRIPGKDNTDRIKGGVNTLLSTEGLPLREIRIPPRRGGEARMLFTLLYATMFLVTFGGIGLILAQLEFTWFSAAIFYFFLCVVSFFAFRLRQNARENVIVEGKARLHNLVLDFVALPILRAGSWLSQSISRINVFLFIFDFLIEAPFKIFLTVLEEWFSFMKEKREELQ